MENDIKKFIFLHNELEGSREKLSITKGSGMNNDLPENQEIHQDLGQHESKKRHHKVTKNHNHRNYKHKDESNKNSFNIDCNKNLEIAAVMENAKNMFRSDAKLKTEFGSRNEIDSSNTNTDILPKGIMDSIRKLPCGIDKINTFLLESIHGGEETDKTNSKTINSENHLKDRQKLTPQKIKISKNKKHRHPEQTANRYSDIDVVKETKSKMSSYVNNFTSKALGESSGTMPRSNCSSKEHHNLKSKPKYTQLKSHSANYSLTVRDGSKHNLRADYIRWLLAEKKFFNKVDSTISINSSTSQTKLQVDKNKRVSFETNELKEEKKNKQKRHHIHKKQNKELEICPSPHENDKVIVTNESSPNNKLTQKNCELVFKEIMSNKDFSIENLRHIRWLVSVENMIRVKSKPYLKKTVSLNELYSYIPTHDANKIENLLQPNHDESCLKEINETHDNHENLNKATNRFQAQLYTATLKNDFRTAFQKSLQSTRKNNYDTCQPLARSESIESVSIAIKKRNNMFDSNGSLNIEIFHNTEDLSEGRSKEDSQVITYGNESNLSNNLYNNYTEYCGGNHNIKHLSVSSGFKKPINTWLESQEIAQVNPNPNLHFDYNIGNCNPDLLVKNRLMSEKASGDFYYTTQKISNNYGIIGETNNNIYRNSGMKNECDFDDEYKQFTGSSYIKVGNNRAPLNNPIRDQPADKECKFKNSRRAIFDKIRRTGYYDPQKYDAQLTYEESTSNEDQSYKVEGFSKFSKFMQCNDQSSSSNCSNTEHEANRKQKYNTEYDVNTESVHGRSERLITIQKSSVHSWSSKNDEKQNEILLVMSELRQKINFIQEQISFMNINCNKCEKIERMLMKLKTDVDAGLKHVQIKLKEIEQDHEQLKSSKQNSETNMFKVDVIAEPEINKKFSQMKTNSLKIFTSTKDDQVNSETYEINRDEHNIFCDALDNLAEQLKRFTINEETIKERDQEKQTVVSKEVGSMTEEIFSVCNYCCGHVKSILNKPETAVFNKGTQLDLKPGIDQFSSSEKIQQLPIEINKSKEEISPDDNNQTTTISEKMCVNSELNKEKKKGIKENKSTSKNTKKNKKLKKTKTCTIL